MELKVGDAKVNKTGTRSPEFIPIEDMNRHADKPTHYTVLSGGPSLGKQGRAKGAKRC